MICLQEYAHIQALHLFGGEGYVRYTIFSGVTKVTTIPTYEHWYVITAIAGGATVVFVYYILDMLIIDAEISIALRLVIGHQIPYTILEPLGLTTHPICSVAVALGMGVAAGYSFPLFRTVMEHDYN